MPLVGWLPRPLQGAWVRAARGVPYCETFLLSARDVERLLTRAGFQDVRVDPAEPVAGDAARLDGPLARLLPLYARLLRTRAGRALLRSVGPLLEATAHAPRA